MADDWDGVDFSEDWVDAENRDDTVDVEYINEADMEEARFDDAFSEATSRRGSPVTLLRDETEDEMVSEYKQISMSDN